MNLIFKCDLFVIGEQYRYLVNTKMENVIN